LPVVIDTHTLVVAPRIGIAVYPDDGLAKETLVGNAYSAMQEARAQDLAYQFYQARNVPRPAATAAEQPEFAAMDTSVAPSGK
ncbi:MAG: hypothetical protein ABI905_18460, partial [Betaproteobacteria bacterium]